MFSKLHRFGLPRRGCLREVLRHAGDGSGYECQEDEGAFMYLVLNRKAVSSERLRVSLLWAFSVVVRSICRTLLDASGVLLYKVHPARAQ